MWRVQQIFAYDRERDDNMPEHHCALRHSSPDVELQNNVQGAVHQVDACALDELWTLKDHTAVGHSKLA
eukprot:8977573-Karenia_brevis.AAC.1